MITSRKLLPQRTPPHGEEEGDTGQGRRGRDRTYIDVSACLAAVDDLIGMPGHPLEWSLRGLTLRTSAHSGSLGEPKCCKCSLDTTPRTPPSRRTPARRRRWSLSLTGGPTRDPDCIDMTLILPAEIVLMILDRCDPLTLGRVRGVNKR